MHFVRVRGKRGEMAPHGPDFAAKRIAVRHPPSSSNIKTKKDYAYY